MKGLPLAVLFCLGCVAQDLQVIAIDVEGGKSTLYLSPSGESMLVDAGYSGNQGRDAQRIVAAAHAAGVKQIDYLVVTHYHKDHVGGVPELAARIPIRTFVDHGRNFEDKKDNGPEYDAYERKRAKGKHLEVKAGDRIPINGLDVKVVTASGVAIHGGGQPNPLCAGFQPIAKDNGENSHSIGLLITFGKFRLVYLGYLLWNREFDLACPTDQLGNVDVYMTTHHGKKTSGSPALVQDLHFKAAVMNNSATTGGSDQHWQTIHDAPGTPDIWQLHAALKNEPAHNSPGQFIANLAAQCRGDSIRLVAHTDGTFVIRNNRTGFEKRY